MNTNIKPIYIMLYDKRAREERKQRVAKYKHKHIQNKIRNKLLGQLEPLFP